MDALQLASVGKGGREYQELLWSQAHPRQVDVREDIGVLQVAYEVLYELL